MGRPKKTLLELVEDNSFVYRQDKHLLDDSDEPPLRWKSLEKIRQQFVAAEDDFTRRRFGLEFDKAVKQLNARRDRQQVSLAVEMEKLGPPGSAKQLKAFFPTYLRWPDGSRFKLDPYQKLTIDLGWKRDRHGRRVFKEIGTGIPRGNGKTPFWSGIGTAGVLTAPGRPKVLQASGSGDVAALGLAYAGDFLDENEALRRWLRSNAKGLRRKDGRGEYAFMKTSGSLGHGRKPNEFLVDELWTIETPTQEKTVSAGETAVFKIQDAFWAWISTAGYSKDTILGVQFDSALKLPHVEHHNEGFHIRAWDEESGRLFLWWGLPEGYPLDLENDKEMLKVIRLANPASWVDHRELLRALKRALSKDEAAVNEWIRFNLNGWTKTKNGWFPAGAWWALRSSASFNYDAIWENDPEIPAGSEIWVGVDAAKKRDTTACVWAARQPSGKIALRNRVWSARDNVPHDVFVPGGRIRNSLVEDFIVYQLGQRYRVREVVYDPRYFDTQGENLADAGFTVAEFPQASGLMADAYQHLYESVIEKTITHAGQPVFGAQIEAVAAVLGENGWIVYRLKSSEPIDSTPAAAMARERCARATEKRNRSVYERKQLQVIEGELPADDVDDELDEAGLIRRHRATERREMSDRLIRALVVTASPIPWADLDELQADDVAVRLAAAAARFADHGQDVRAALCHAELVARPPTDDGE